MTYCLKENKKSSYTLSKTMLNMSGVELKHKSHLLQLINAPDTVCNGEEHCLMFHSHTIKGITVVLDGCIEFHPYSHIPTIINISQMF